MAVESVLLQINAIKITIKKDIFAFCLIVLIIQVRVQRERGMFDGDGRHDTEYKEP